MLDTASQWRRERDEWRSLNRELKAEVKRLRASEDVRIMIAEVERDEARAEVERLTAALRAEAESKCSCYEAGFWCRPCWAHYTLTGEERESAIFPGEGGQS